MKKIINKQLGELLVERGIINAKQLEQALKMQKEDGSLLGQALVALGHATEEEIAHAITAQYGFPFLPLKGYEIEQDVINMVPENVARQYGIIPLDKMGDTLTIAMSNPLNMQAAEDIEMLTKSNVQVFVCTLTDLNEAITRYYTKT